MSAHLTRLATSRAFIVAYAFSDVSYTELLLQRQLLRIGIRVATSLIMLKLLGSYALAKLLGFGLIGAIVIYALLSLLT